LISQAALHRQLSSEKHVSHHAGAAVAVNNTCRMHVIMASNDGADRDMIRSLVGVDESLIFVHQSKVYQEQPTSLPVLAELWMRPLRKMGLTARHGMFSR